MLAPSLLEPPVMVSNCPAHRNPVSSPLQLDAEAQRHLARLRVGSWGEGAWCCIGPAAVTLCQDRGRGRPEIPEGQAPGVPLAAGWRVVLDDEEAW